MTHRSIWALLVLMATALTLASCQTSTTAVPPNLSPQAQALPVERRGVEGWEQIISFGSFELDTRPVDKSQAGDWAFLGIKSFQPTQEFAFSLQDNVGIGWAGRCALGAINTQPDINLPGIVPISRVLEGSARLILGCVFQPGLDKVWRMSLSSNGEGWRLGGLLSDGVQTSIQVRASQQLAGQSLESKPPLSRPLQTYRQYQETAAGYSFEVDGKNLGGVRVAGAQMVWLPPGKLHRPLAAASAALLLLRDLKIPQ